MQDWNISSSGASNKKKCFFQCSAERINMSRLILHVTAATIAFIVGVAANWSMNTFGGFAVDKIYVDGSIPSFLQAKPSDVRTWNRGTIGCRQHAGGSNRGR